jgi:type II secretory pathway component PulF
MIANVTFPSLLGQMDNDLVFGIFVTALRFVGMLLGAVFSLAIYVLAIYIIHFFFSLPMRRNERARLFLNLVEGSLTRGQSVETMILSLAQSRDRSLGVRFHLISAYIEGGLKFNEAIDKVPRFLPNQISEMLRAGANLGDLKKVLPACREILRERPAAVRSAQHYMLLIVLFFSPVTIFLIMIIQIFIVPRFKDVAMGMGIRIGPLAHFVFDSTFWLVGFEITLTLLLGFATLIYVGGPRFTRWFQFKSVPVIDWVAWHVPWKQKRLQHTFSAMLAVLLDAGVPEAEAVRLAGDCTVNEICRQRAQGVIDALANGIPLDNAVRSFDESGEFHWRLTNATHAHGGFLAALRGWHAALDAKAFQQEETTAQMVTTGLVILNGMVVALIAIAMFGMLVGIIPL